MDRVQEFGELRAKVELLLRSQEQTYQEMREGFLRLETKLGERLNKHSDRLGRLERWRDWVIGGVSFAIFLWSVLLAWLNLRR